MDMDEHISYEDFSKLDIRVGTIIEATRVPDTDKLIQCTIDFGAMGRRVIVSGIAQWRAPEDLIGKQCPYVVNLAPRELRGIVSEGMLLAAGHENGIALLHPDSSVEPGTRIK
ncbi:MAG: Methionine-tRNA ligase [Parcubacteria group bacterium GW2011_GWA2_51_10]|nr:MAG: Methionine-tRNA ligase [Parcubacteria group bacterium GW2011_GWA2_51_10]